MCDKILKEQEYSIREGRNVKPIYKIMLFTLVPTLSIVVFVPGLFLPALLGVITFTTSIVITSLIYGKDV